MCKVGFQSLTRVPNRVPDYYDLSTDERWVYDKEMFTYENRLLINDNYHNASGVVFDKKDKGKQIPQEVLNGFEIDFDKLILTSKTEGGDEIIYNLSRPVVVKLKLNTNQKKKY